MKSSKLTDEARAERLDRLFWKREDLRAAHKKRGRTYVQYRTTRKVFKKSLLGKVTVSHDSKPYPHQSARQAARYARQSEGRANG